MNLIKKKESTSINDNRKELDDLPIIEVSIDDEVLKAKLPASLKEKVKKTADNEATLNFSDKGATISFKQNNQRTIPLIWYLIPTIIASLAFFIYLLVDKQVQVPLTGDLSIATMVIIIGLISGVLSFIIAFIYAKRSTIYLSSKDIYWRNFPTIVLSFAIILFFALSLVFNIIGSVFDGVSFDIYTSVMIFAVMIMLINYAMINISLTMTPRDITNLFIVVVIGGVFLAMSTNSDKQWWQHNFSFLGTDEATKSWQFNVTLIFSAFLLIALIDFIFVSLRKVLPNTKRLMALNILLILVAVSLALVGFFPYNNIPFYQSMHNRAAGWLVYLIIILIASLKWLLPSISKQFLRISYFIVSMLVIVIFLFYGIHYLSLTAFELLSFMLAFSWLLLLIYNLQRLAQKMHQSYEIKIIALEDSPNDEE